MPLKVWLGTRIKAPMWAMIALLVASATVRGGVILARWGHLSQDPDAYRLIAENLVQRGVYSRSPADSPAAPTAFRPPLYPLVLAGVAHNGRVMPPAVAVLHVLIGTLTVYLVLVLARMWGLGLFSWLVATLVVLDPILLNQSVEVMTETLATLLAVVCLLALTYWSRRQSHWAAMSSGAALGLATLCRPTFMVWTVLIVVAVVFERSSWVRVRQAALLVATAAVVLLPWTVRNDRVIGQPVWATTHGGYTLLLGNNIYFYRHLRQTPRRQVWDARELQPLLAECASFTRDDDRAKHPELVSDRRLYEAARQTIQDHPFMFAYAGLVRIGRFWSPLPHRLHNDESIWQAAARWGVAAWYSICFALALCGVWRLRRRIRTGPWVWGLCCVAAFTLVHSVYWSNMRMRAPVMPVVYLTLAAACTGNRQQDD